MHLTANLIAYWGYAEGKRHNEASEAETARHNKAMEDYNRDSLLEVIRHNVATETEINRSNLAREVETMRHNVAVETETERSNRANEDIKRESNQIGWANVGLGYAQLAEATRHNQAYEAYQTAALEESARHNKAMEDHQTSVLQENRLHNRLTELDDWRSTNLGYLQSSRNYSLGLGGLYLDYNKLSETKRHNQRSEELQEYSNKTARANAWTSGFKNVTEAVSNVIPWLD